MIYTKEDLLKVWRTIINTPNSTVEFENIVSSDIWNVSNTNILCPRCRLEKKILFRLNNIWQCVECHNISKIKNILWTDARLIYRITNDLIAYFGEVTSEKLFDSELISGFVRFGKLENNPRAYFLMLQLVKAVLAKEVGALKIIDYISDAESKIKEKKENDRNKFSTNTGKNKKPDANSTVASGISDVS